MTVSLHIRCRRETAQTVLHDFLSPISIRLQSSVTETLNRRSTTGAFSRGVRVCLALIALLTGAVFAQEPNIESYLARIENGEVEQVRAELPSLLKANPNSPGVLYLQALLTTDGSEAVRLYQNIVDTYPKSDWADDALWKTYKFYTAIGLHRTAEIKWNQLKTNYPESKYISGSIQESRAVVERTVVVPQEKEIERKTQRSTPEPAASGAFTLQVGVYSSAANANRQAQFFEYQKYPTRIVRKMKGERELFYVFVGSFATAAEAQAKGGEIKREFNIDYFIAKP